MKTVLILKLDEDKYFCRQMYGSMSLCTRIEDAHKFNSKKELYTMYHTTYKHAWKQLLGLYPKHELITKLVVEE